MDAEHKGSSPSDLDRLLDAALHARADAEPRTGLEDRVLARLAAASGPQRIIWWPTFAALATAFVIAMAIVVMHSDHSQPTTVARQQPAHGASKSVIQADAAPSDATHDSRRKQVRPPKAEDAVCCVSTKMAANRVPGGRRSVRASGIHPTDDRLKDNRLPKLPTFPAAHPPTTDEKILAQLAARQGSYEVASIAAYLTEPKDLSVPELKIEPLEGTPADNAPQE